MSLLPITLAATVADRTRALIDGAIHPEGIDLNYIPLAAEEIFWRMARFAEFDAAEMSATAYIIERSRPNPRFVAVPVFLSRCFRHSAIYVNVDSGIERPQDLVGKRVGAPEYALTALTWVRGILEHEYGVHPSQIEWLVGGQEAPGREERAHFTPPPGVSIERIPPDETLNHMIIRGDLDALIAPRIPRPFTENDPAIRRLFPDVQKVEEDYYRRTGIFPIMHILVIREELYQQHRWVAESLYKAFCQAKDECLRAMYDATSLPCTLPWLIAEIERERQVFGVDLWPYGLEASRVTLEAMVQYHVEQGLIPEPVPVEQLFAEPTLAEFRV